MVEIVTLILLLIPQERQRNVWEAEHEQTDVWSFGKKS